MTEFQRAILHLEILSINWMMAADTALGKAAWLLWYYDNYTNPRLFNSRTEYLIWLSEREESERVFRGVAIARMMMAASNRVLLRRQLHRDNITDPVTIHHRVSAELFDPILASYVATIQATVVDAFYGPTTSSSFDYVGVAKAFERFATGAGVLRRIVWTPDATDVPSQGSPDGAAIFLFAEFAFMALEQRVGVDQDFWLALLPIFVGMQDLYCRAYRNPMPGPGDEHFDSWSGAPYAEVPPEILAGWYQTAKHESSGDLLVRMGRQLYDRLGDPTPLAN